MTPVATRLALALASFWALVGAHAQSPQPLRKLGEMEVTLLGLGASVDPLDPVVPKNVAAGVRVAVQAGGRVLNAAEVQQLLGGPFQVQGELSGPGLPATLSLPQSGPGAVPAPDPLVLTFPGLPQGGEYDLSNLRLVQGGRIALDVTPRHVRLRVIDQILVTSVQTQALTLDEIRARGIVLDADSYLGFQFTVQVLVESTPVQLDFPVVFDREGVALPLPLQPPPDPLRTGNLVRAPLMVPVLLKPSAESGAGGGGDLPPLSLPDGQPVRIPSLLVIPGNVGYLKQFFSAQLVVANGAPQGSGLLVRNVSGTIGLPPGADGVPGTGDDPLTLPVTDGGPQSPTHAVLREDGTGDLFPGEQGRAEFTLRGEKEGFHALEFDLSADLDGLAVGTVPVTGKARGGVLVRNAYLDTTFTLPSVVRADEEFTVFTTVTNIGQGTAYDVDVALDPTRLSGATLLSAATQTIDALVPGDARVLEYRFRSRTTGQVVASYLKFDTNGGTDVTGRLNFTLGVGERGVALSPDTLVLPTAVDALPAAVVRAAMRVLGQAWSAATAPTLPAGVAPITTATVTRKAIALAEAGLRVKLRGSTEAARREALRDLLLDLHGGQDGVDAGFDQLLRETQAGADLDATLGTLLGAPVAAAGGVLEYEQQLAELASSGAPFVSFSVDHAGNGPAADVLLLDAQGRRLGAGGPREVPGALLVRAGAEAGASLLGFVAAPGDGALTLQLNGTADGALDVSVTIPSADGGVLRAEVRGLLQTALSRARVVYAPGASQPLELQQDAAGDGVYESVQPLATSSVASQGPRLLAAATIGPETISGATPLGVYAALLFDRVVDADDATDTGNYAMERNEVRAARRQLSGRLVFAALEQPEGPLVPAQIEVTGLHDTDGRGGSRQSVVLGSRLTLPGAVVSGRVLQSDGTPVGGARVVYGNVWSAGCAVTDWAGVATQETDDTGRFEFRYVLQSPCGGPFRLDTRDPATGAARGVKLFVQSNGQRILTDLVLLGRGSVAGRVHRGDGSAAPGARVRVASLTDAQVAGFATADGNGDYLVRNIPVGPVTVTAVLGPHLGRAAGSIATAGATAQVPVSLDGDVSFTGVVHKLQDGVLSAVPGVDVVYYRGSLPLGVAVTDAQGRFELAGMPPGSYLLNAALNTRDQVWVSGSAAAGQTIAHNLVIDVLAGSVHGTVQGHVYLPSGAPAAGAWVSDDNAAATTADASGTYALAGVVVRPGAQTIRAVSADGRRSGSASAIVSAAGQVVNGVDIQLSGLGSAELHVTDAQGQPLAGQTVALTGNCLHPCGCRFEQTNVLGVARFDGLPLGSVGAQAVRVVGGVSVDVASASVLVSDEDVPGAATLRFSAPGSVSVTVTNPGGGPAAGAEVRLTSLAFVNDGVFTCGLVSKLTQTGHTDAASGTVVFHGVHAGNVAVDVSSFAFPNSVRVAGVLAEGGHLSLGAQLVNTLAGELSGHVLLPDGSGAVGAGVEVTASAAWRPDVTVTTGADGRYAFASVLPGGVYLLTARDVRPGGTGSVAQIRVALTAGSASSHDLRLKARGSVRVTVVDGADNVVDAVSVRLRESEFPGQMQERSFVTVEQQPLVFTSVFAGAIAVEASDAWGRGGRASAVLPPDGQTVDVKVRLTTTGHVRGHFYLPDAVTAIPNATVRLVSGYRVIGQVTTLADSDVGSFAFDYVPAGAVRLEAEDPRTGRTGVATGTLDSEGQLLLLDLRAQGLGRVQGEVSLNQQPQASAEVSLRSGVYHVRVTSDAAGHYAVDGVPEGQIAASADLGGSLLLGTAAGVLAGDGQTLELPIALRGAGSIDGQLLDADGVSPGRVSAITLKAFGSWQTTASDASGHFHFDLVPEGPVELVADALQSLDCARESYGVSAGQTLPVALRLRGVGALDGSVSSSAGPVAGRLTIVGTGTGPGCAPGWGLTLQIGASGLFQVPEMVAGPVTLAFATGPFGGPWLYASQAAQVNPGATTHATLQLEPAGSLRGVLHHESGGVSIGAAVSVLASQGRWLLEQTRADGSFLVRGVPAGPVTVYFRDASTGGLARTTATIADNVTTDMGPLTLAESALAVVATAPLPGALDVPTNAVVALTFSAPLAHAGGIAVLANGRPRGFAATLAGDGLSISPSGTWPDASEIEVQATTYVTDVLGRHLPAPVSLRFRTVDLSAPKVTSVVPAQGAIEVGSDALVTVTFDEPIDTTGDLQAVVHLSGPGGAVSGSVAAASPTTLVFTPVASLPINALFTVTVNSARDLRGQTQTVAFTSSFATLDTLVPDVIPWTPLAGTWTSSTRPSFLFGAHDTTSGPAATAVLGLDGQPRVVPNSIPGWYYYNTPIDLAEGLHTYTATVQDRAGNANSFTASFGVDTQPPTPAAFVGLSDGQVLSGTARLTGTASDAGSGIKYAHFRRGYTGWNAIVTGDTYYYDWATTSEADGPYTWTTQAIDGVGHSSVASAPITVYVNNHPLTTSITSPAAGTAVRDQVAVTANVNESVQRVEFRAGGQAAVVDDTAPYAVTLDLTALPEGSATLTVTAFGIVPGETAVAGLTLQVDRTPPPAPDPARISASSDGGTVLVLGQAGAVEGGVRVEASNASAGTSGFALAAASDGSFALQLGGLLDQVLTLTAVDAAGNRSASTQVTVTDGYTADGVPLAGLKLWVESDKGVTSDASSYVSRWQDQSGNANDLVQGVAAEQPRVQSAQISSSVNQPVVHCDGSNDSLALTTRIASAETVLALVVDQEVAPSQYRLLFGDTGNTSKPFFGNAPALWHPNYASQDVINGDTRLNGVAVAGTTEPRPRSFAVLSVQPRAGVPMDRLCRDLDNGVPWWGDVAAVLVYNRVLSTADYKAAEDYLARRYALYVPQVSQPQVTPYGGTFSGTTTVVLTTRTPGAQIRYTLDGSDPTLDSTLYAGPFVLDNTVTVKAKAFLDGAAGSSTAVAGFVESSSNSPARFPGLVFWARADAEVTASRAGLVSRWKDLSGQHNDLVQTTPAEQPLLVFGAAHGLPALRFDGTNDSLAFTTALTNLRTVVALLRETPTQTTQNYRNLFGTIGSGNYPFFGGAPALWHSGMSSTAVRNGQTRLGGLVVDGATAARPTEMTVLSLVTTGPVVVDRLFRDLDNSMPWVGEIAELALYDRALSASERQAVEDYFAAKYRPGTTAPTAGAPAFSPNGGLFTDSVSVSISSTTPGAAMRYTLDGSEPSETSDLYTAPLGLSATTVVKARTFAPNMTPSAVASVRFEKDTGWSPAGVPDMALWVSTDAGLSTSGGDGVAAWSDRGAAHNDLVQPQGTLQPKVVQNPPGTFGGLPTVRFDGSNDALKLTTPLQGTLTAFAVLSQRAGASAVYRSLFGATGSSSYAFFGGTSTLWDPSYSSALVRNGQTWLNGQPVNGAATARPTAPSVLSVITQADSPTTPAILVDSVFQDADNNSPWDGDIAELLIYRRALTNAERKRIEDYLVEKYRPYTPTTATPTVVPNGGAFAGPVSVSLGTTTANADVRYTLDGSEPDGTSSALYSGPFEIAATTTVRAKAFRADLAPSATATVTLLLPGAFRPSDLGGLSLWLRADAGVARESGERVYSWANQAPAPAPPLAPNDARLGTALGLPAVSTSTYAGLPALRFDGSDDYLLLTRSITDVRTVFWVVRQDVAAPATYRYLLGDATAAHFCGGTTSIWLSGSASLYVTGGQTRLGGVLVNATQVARPTAMSVLSLVTTGNVTTDRLMRHAIYSSPWFGDLAEVIVYDRALTAPEVSQVEQYLGARYGITVQP